VRVRAREAIMKIHESLIGREVTALVDGFPVRGTYRGSVNDGTKDLENIGSGFFDPDRISGYARGGVVLDGCLVL
jgi:hypothetical protein